MGTAVSLNRLSANTSDDANNDAELPAYNRRSTASCLPSRPELHLPEAGPCRDTISQLSGCEKCSEYLEWVQQCRSRRKRYCDGDLIFAIVLVPRLYTSLFAFYALKTERLEWICSSRILIKMSNGAPQCFISGHWVLILSLGRTGPISKVVHKTIMHRMVWILFGCISSVWFGLLTIYLFGEYLAELQCPMS